MPGNNKRTLSQGELAFVVAELRERACAIDRLAKAMDSEGVETIDVQGMVGVREGIAAIDKFILKCKGALGRF